MNSKLSFFPKQKKIILLDKNFSPFLTSSLVIQNICSNESPVGFSPAGLLFWNAPFKLTSSLVRPPAPVSSLQGRGQQSRVHAHAGGRRRSQPCPQREGSLVTSAGCLLVFSSSLGTGRLCGMLTLALPFPRSHPPSLSLLSRCISSLSFPFARPPFSFFLPAPCPALVVGG